MLFDLTAHKVRVILETAIAAAVGGAVSSITVALADPKAFNFADPAEWKRLGVVATAGAATGVLFLLRNLPRNPVAVERRSDRVQVARQAEKLGIVDPETVAVVEEEHKKVRGKL